MNIDKLSKQEKLDLLDLIEEKERLERVRRPPFKPHPGQMDIIKSPALEKYLFCGNGYGKTTLMVNWLHWKATGYNPITKENTAVPATIYLVVDDPGKIEQIIIPEYQKWYELDTEKQCSKCGKPFYSKISYPNGSVIHILTHEVNLLKMEGVEMTHLAFDEPPPRHVYIGLYRGGRILDRDLEIFLVGTPLYQAWMRIEIHEAWLRDELEDTECFTGEMDDNPHLNPKYKKKFGAKLSEEEKLVRFKGNFADLAGQALAHMWETKIHMIDPAKVPWDPEWPCCIAIDPHTSKAHHAVLMGADRDDNLYVIDEYQRKVLPRVFIQDLVDKGWFEDRRIVDIVHDCSGNADMTGGEGYKSFNHVANEVLKKNGIGRARGTNFKDKDDEDFVERIQENLFIPEPAPNGFQQPPKLRFFDHCAGCANDIKQVQWQRDKKLGENKKKLEIRYRDFLACIKYALTCNLNTKRARSKMVVYNKPMYGFKPRHQRIRASRVRAMKNKLTRR